MSDSITKLARGMPCQVRLAGICNFNPETTVLAHYRLSGLCGIGLKPPSLIGAWTCSSCHDYCDGRAQSANLTKIEIRLAFAEGVFRTQNELIRLGKIRT